MTTPASKMILSLKDKVDDPVSVVGGKAASLMKLYSIPGLSQHVPAGYALTVDFFSEWVQVVLASPPYQKALVKLTSNNNDASIAELTQVCDRVKEYCVTKLELSAPQQAAIDQISQDMKNDHWKLPLAAVRSSAPEEDGLGASFAGAFETVLGVPSDGLVAAVKQCFASLFDYRVFSYMRNSDNATSTENHQPSFAVVVMEMVDSEMAGVAFSVNPINSDLDELVVDCSYGLGESVVDGSVVADRYVYNKTDHVMVEVTVGSKKQEKRLDCTDGGAHVKQVSEERQQKRTLSDEQIKHLCGLMCTIEEVYDMPMDVEFAFSQGTNGLNLKLLQARPITTTFTLDEKLLTKPGERRVLYYDFNVASEATTTEPFTHMDMQLYNKIMDCLFDDPSAPNLLTTNPEMPMFYASTRQYCNMSVFFRWSHPKTFSQQVQVLDPYLARTFESSDCDRKKYRAMKKHKDINLRNAFKLIRKFAMWKYYKIGRKYMNNPAEAKKEYIRIFQECHSKLRERQARGMDPTQGLGQYYDDLVRLMMPVLDEELGGVMFGILPTMTKLDKGRRNGETEEIRQECEALCAGYDGDPLMESNIAMYKLAQSLPLSIWSEYDHNSFDKLAERLQDNLDGKISDLPSEFLGNWKSFMDRFGYDGTPQLFVSSPRYIDNPDLLLAVVSHSKGEGVTNPAQVQEGKVAARREVMAKHKAQAKKKWWSPGALSKIQKRNERLENLMWIRNRPKLNFAYIFGMLREAIVATELEFVQKGRLEKPGDVFHLGIDEFDKALQDESMDLMQLVRPRRARFDQAKKCKVCPMLVDSRNRILRPDVIKSDKPGTLIGSPISPGVATGRVRLVHDPLEPFETGEVLVAIVTDPAWTPLFIGASAVIFQVGGVLQHGALCAREYGKPGVSGIEIQSSLKNGMLVSVDGNTGVVTVLEREEAKAQ